MVAIFSDLDYYDGVNSFDDENEDNSSMISMSSSMNEENEGDAPF